MVEQTGRLGVVTLREGGLMHRITTSVLNQAERDYEIVFMAVSSAGLLAAVAAGLGVALLPRREVPPSIEVCDEPFLPKLPEVYCGIYLRERLDCEMLEALGRKDLKCHGQRKAVGAAALAQVNLSLPSRTDQP